MNKFEYVNASSVKSATEQLQSDGSVRIKAGGIDILDELKERTINPKRLVNIKTVGGLKEIKEVKDSLHIGTLVTLSELASNKQVKTLFPALAEAALGAATPQIRNVATIGGNICQRPRCWYYRSEEFSCLKKGGNECHAHLGDNRFHAIFGNDKCAMVHPSATAVALVALQAKLKIEDTKGHRIVEIDNFFVKPEENAKAENILKPTEIITEVILAKPAVGSRNFYIKLKEKQSFDWPMADVAVAMEMAGGVCKAARVVLGAAAPVPWRAVAVEKALVGKKVDASVAEEVSRLAIEGAKPMSHNGYKLKVFETIVARALSVVASGDFSSKEGF
ncbi:MAG: FAD binding domain-containing protein [Blastocatellia bacterium]|nr:FAD binding domain-containing protein [Blastocatellia bacterium]